MQLLLVRLHVITTLFEMNCVNNVNRPIPGSGQTALAMASSNGHEAAVKILLKYGADPTRVDRDGWNALHAAANCCASELMALLISSSVQDIPRIDIDARTNEGETAWMIIEKKAFDIDDDEEEEAEEADECLDWLIMMGARDLKKPSVVSEPGVGQDNHQLAADWADTDGGICTAG